VTAVAAPSCAGRADGTLSCLYEGTIRHRRRGPQTEFRHRIELAYVDLDELPRLLGGRLVRRGPGLLRFRRADYLGGRDGTESSLGDAVRERVQTLTGERPAGPIRLLAQLRSCGICFNPVSFYYCFDREDREVETIVAEITNTPWHERHAYVLPVSQAELEGSSWRFRFAKQFHISPFLPMDMAYDWRLSPPADRLQVHMQNWRDERAAFTATLNLTRRELSGPALARALLAFPVMTGQVTAAIYWQALRLALKRTPFFSHPRLS
jgi:DUF1365 family protein